MKMLLVLTFALTVLFGCGKAAEVDPSVWKVPDQPTVDASGQRNMVIVFDASGSMNDHSKLAQAKKATKIYVDSLPPDVGVGLIVFSGYIKKLADIGTDRTSFKSAVDGISGSGGTPLGKAVGQAYETLAERAKALQGQGEYHLVVVTDGQAEDNSLLKENVDIILGQSPVRIFTIGFRIGSSHPLNTPGPQMRYVPAENEAEIGKGLQKVLAEAMPEPAKP